MALRDAAWLTPDRARAWCRVLLAAFLIFLALALGWIAAIGSVLDPLGKAIGTDFLSFYAASDLALQGRPAEAYSVTAHAAAQVRVAGPTAGYAAFFYPPGFLLLVLPLATLPYLPALAAWLALTGAAYWGALRPLLPRGWGTIAVAAFPAAFLTLGHGQNAFLSTALLAVAAGMLDRRPAVAGICIGLLGFKPHLALLAPVVLAAAGRWRAFAAAAAALSALLLASFGLFGAETWRAFLAGLPLARAALEMDLVGPAKMVSPFAAARLLGAPVPGAYAVQGIAAIGAAVAAAMLARRRVEGTALIAMIAAGGVLASPFLLDYDLLILAVPLAYVASAAARAGGFLPWEKTILGVAFLLPLISRSLASAAGIPVAPLITAALFAVVLRRALWDGATAALGDNGRRRLPQLDRAAGDQRDAVGEGVSHGNGDGRHAGTGGTATEHDREG